MTKLREWLALSHFWLVASRWQALAAIFLAVFTIGSAVTLYGMSAERQLLGQTARSNADMAHLLSYSHWSGFTQLLAAGRILPAEQSAGTRVYSLLKKDLQTRLSGSRLVDVRLYDLNGKAVMTADAAELGRSMKIDSTLDYPSTFTDYVASSRLESRGEMMGLSGQIVNRDIVVTRLPLKSPLNQQQVGSIEIVSDVSAEVAAIGMARWKLLGWLSLMVTAVVAGGFIFAKRAGQALQNAQQEVVDYQMEAGRLAIHEPLTGLLNRGSFHRKYDGILKRSRRSGNLFGMIAIDLDEFGGINEAFGYEAGDKLLQVMARRLKSGIRETDSVFRLDGDRFVVLLEDISKYADAFDVAEKLHKTLNKPVNFGEFDVRMTSSCGVVVYPADGQQAEILERRMNVALARAKASGRNMILRYSDKVRKIA